MHTMREQQETRRRKFAEMMVQTAPANIEADFFTHRHSRTSEDIVENRGEHGCIAWPCTPAFTANTGMSRQSWQASHPPAPGRNHHRKSAFNKLGKPPPPLPFASSSHTQVNWPATPQGRHPSSLVSTAPTSIHAVSSMSGSDGDILNTVPSYDGSRAVPWPSPVTVSPMLRPVTPRDSCCSLIKKNEEDVRRSLKDGLPVGLTETCFRGKLEQQFYFGDDKFDNYCHCKIESSNSHRWPQNILQRHF